MEKFTHSKDSLFSHLTHECLHDRGALLATVRRLNILKLRGQTVEGRSLHKNYLYTTTILLHLSDHGTALLASTL